MSETEEGRYPVEVLGPNDDDGTMVSNVETLAAAVVGHRIVSGEHRTVTYDNYGFERTMSAFVITLDDGTEVRLRSTDDCCAYTELEAFLLHPDRVDHVIMGVGTTEGYSRWHIYADWGDVLEFTVGWSCGNPFHYAFGFDIDVVALSKHSDALVAAAIGLADETAAIRFKTIVDSRIELALMTIQQLAVGLSNGQAQDYLSALSVEVDNKLSALERQMEEE